MRRSIALPLLLVAVLGSTAAACRRSAAREWRPEDHDQEQPGQGQQAQNSMPTQGADAEMALVEAAWSNNCVQCHGRMGFGDGPQGPMVKAPNLTDPAVVDKFTDDELATIIKSGRNKMPAFPSLPDRVVRGLVLRVRTNEQR